VQQERVYPNVHPRFFPQAGVESMNPFDVAFSEFCAERKLDREKVLQKLPWLQAVLSPEAAPK